MSIETDRDLVAMRAVGRVVRLALRAMRRAIVPGVSTAEIDGVAEEVFRANGARSAPQTFYGFPGLT